ncbi:TerC family protein [Desulfovibrio inopinatus]|uniref:TerC family protein n=1 Tax=Desulfovibrio inopinatus TaxID=102109 RepID=UPI0003F5BF49|nr:TerC family protein [Desulfovibrio inopinatus]
MADSLGILLLLIGLELVLGVDNVLVLAIMVERLDPALRRKARIIGLGLALIARLGLLLLVLALTSLTAPVFMQFSVRDLILLAGGLFLLWKAVREIHHTVELKEEQDEAAGIKKKSSFRTAILQIVLLDIVFSIDSVITAVGLTHVVWVIITAVVISFAAVLAYAGPVGEFIIKHPTLKILALSFLITIGVTIFMEGMHQEVPKAYIYLPMGFALVVEMLQMRYEHNRKKMRS